MRGSDDVIQVIQATPVGEKVTLTVLRNGKREKIPAEVARRPGAEEMLAVGGPRDLGLSWRGMRLEPLTEELRTQTGLKTNDRGAFVKEVKDGSPAADAGIVPGMVIDQVGDKRIASVREFTAAVTAVDGPCMVHIIGLGVKVIQPPCRHRRPPDTKTPAREIQGQGPADQACRDADRQACGNPDRRSRPQRRRPSRQRRRPTSLPSRRRLSLPNLFGAF